ASPALEELRFGLTEVVRATPYVTRFPDVLDPSPFPVTIRVRETAAGSPHPLPRWWGDDDRPLVYVTFGTVLGHMTRAGDVFRLVLSAVGGAGARVLGAVGAAVDPAALGSLDPGIHVEQWVDQTDVLAEASVVVCHGGSGTTLGALAAGVPLVMVPQFADQFVNGERIASSGAGRCVAPAA